MSEYSPCADCRVARYMKRDGNPCEGCEVTKLRQEVSDLAKAKQEGRLVVLPCKVGDKVKVDCKTWGNVWNYKTFEYGKFLHGEIISIIRTKKQTLMKIQVEHNVPRKHERKRYPVSALGKTVFLLPVAAEAAMKGEEQ